MNKKIPRLFLILFLSILFARCRSTSSQSVYESAACDLNAMAVKGKITRIYQGKQLEFYIDSIKESFPLDFELDKDSYREINEVGKGEIYMLPIVGDSIFKQKNSAYIKFKRRDKIFIEHLILRGCN